MIELLVVISIIGILAAMIFPALARAKTAAKIQSARLQIGQIVSAVNTYEQAYSRLPVSTLAMEAASAKNEDFTFGTYNVTNNGIMDWSKGAGSHKIPADIEAVYASGSSLVNFNTYQANNSEVIAILMDKVAFPSAGASTPVPTVNAGHVKNPQQTPFLNAAIVELGTKPGVGPDLVYRDPWSNPYIISMDLNSDEKTRDAVYRRHQVSQKGWTTGYNGLGTTDNSGNGDIWEGSSHVMVWSAGPDKGINTTTSANVTPNLDNILSWK